MEDRISRQHQELVVDHYLESVDEATAMTVKDFVVRCDTSTAAFTLTLPQVVQAKGKIYTIKLITGSDDGGAVHDLTITPVGTAPYKEPMRWNGDVVLDRSGEAILFFSDGEAWHIIGHSVGTPMIHKKQIHEMFDLPWTCEDKAGSGTPSTTTENALICGSGNVFSVEPLATQTLMVPVFADPGMNVAGDQTDNDGFEITNGIGTGSPIQFVVGTDPAFYCRIKFTITTVAGTDDCAFGFRKREAYTAAINDYTDYAVLNVMEGDIYIETALNDAADASNDTTDDWADGEAHTLEVRVSALGVVTYLIDGAAPSTTQTFTFDDGDTVIPFFFMLQANADQTDAVTIWEWEAGHQA